MIEEVLTNMVPWHTLRSLPGTSAYVAGAVRNLLAADTEEDAEAAYWQLDNRLVVQGQLFEAAPSVVAPLVVALSGALPTWVRSRIVNLLVEIACGQPDESELRLGNPDLAERCIRELRGGLWTIYGLLEDPVSEVRIGALDLLDVLELERERLAAVASAIAANDPDEAVATRAAELTQRERDRDL